MTPPNKLHGGDGKHSSSRQKTSERGGSNRNQITDESCLTPRQELDRLISSLLNNEKDSKYLYNFTRNVVRQYSLTGMYQEDFVINEAYRRAVCSIQKGKELEFCSQGVNKEKRFHAWMRSTCKNIVRELARHEKKTKKLCEKIQGCHNTESDAAFGNPETGCRSELISQEDILRYLDQYTNCHLDSWIIYLRVMEELSWNAVCKQLIDRELVSDHIFSNKVVNRIKKRYERIIKFFPKDIF